MVLGGWWTSGCLCDVGSSSGFQGRCGLALLPCTVTSCPWQLCVFLHASFVVYAAVLRWPCDPGSHPVSWVGPGYASRPLLLAWAGVRNQLCVRAAGLSRLACLQSTAAPSWRRCFVFSGLMRNTCPVVRPRFPSFLPFRVSWPPRSASSGSLQPRPSVASPQ